MIGLDRRGFIGAALASAVAPGASPDEGAVSIADFIEPGAIGHEEAFRAALAAGATVVVPSGTYHFSSGKPVEIPAGRRLVGSRGASIRKHGAHLQPLFRASGVHGVVLQGLELRGAERLEQHIVLRPGQREFPLPWPLGIPPAIALSLVADGRQLPLQPEADFTTRGNMIVILPKVDVTGVTAVLMWREQALCPLVELYETSDSSLLDLECFDGALWIRGAEDKPLRTSVQGCTLNNGQIRVWGRDNEINPLHTNRRRSEIPNGPRSIRIEQNRLVGRIGPSAPKHYLKFGERAAGIEIQSFASDIAIVGNDIRRQAGDGVWLASCSDSLVADNHIEGNALSGVGLESGIVRESQRCIVRGNTVLDNWFDGCDLNFGSGPAEGEITITDNLFAGNGFDMSPVSGGCGIFVNGVRKAEIVANVCQDNNVGGIVCMKSDAIRLQDNRCLDNGRSARRRFGVGVGIGVNNATNISVVNNICNRGGRSRQQAGVAFATEIDRQRATVAGNAAPDGRAAEIGIWNGRDYG